MKEQRHEAFADLVARGTQPGEAFKLAYKKPDLNENAARQGAWRLMKKNEVTDLIETKRRELTQAADAVAIQEMAKEKKFKALDLATKREILYKIATGSKFPFVNGKGEKVYRYPKDEDRIRAIELDNEMTGEGWRPPEPPAGGNTFNGPVYNTVIRKTVFKTRETTSRQTFQIEGGEQ